MKKIVQKEMVQMEVPKYIAEDGTVFNNENDCAIHETELLSKTISHIPISEWGVPYCDQDYTYRWYYVKSQVEVDAICHYYNAKSAYNELDIHLDKFPQWICFEESDNSSDVWYKCNLQEYLQEVRDLEMYLTQLFICPVCGNAEHQPDASVCEKCKTGIVWPERKRTRMALVDITKDENRCEAFADELIKQIRTNDIHPAKVGLQVAQAYLSGDVKELIIALSGWGMESIIGFIKNERTVD